MDNQQAFNIVVQHLRTQGAQSTGPWGEGGNTCFYRHPDGIKRCAVGVLIPDSEYSPSLENVPVGHVYDMLPCLHGLSLSLLKELQAAHDNETYQHIPGMTWLKHMESQYQVIAKRYDLTIPTHPCEAVDETPKLSMPTCLSTVS